MVLFYPEYDVLRAVLIFDLAKTKDDHESVDLTKVTKGREMHESFFGAGVFA